MKCSWQPGRIAFVYLVRMLLLESGRRTLSIPAADITTSVAPNIGNSGFIPEVGIVLTPVMNPTNNMLHAITRTKENGTYLPELQAMNPSNRTEKTGSPVNIVQS